MPGTRCSTKARSIFALPAIAELVGLAGAEFGTWVGASVHDVGQVVATASHGDAAAVEAATVVKLTRVVCWHRWWRSTAVAAAAAR